MNEIPNSISKRYLWRYVNKKINRSVHHYKVFSVICILFEELLKDLLDGKEIKIKNLGILSLQQTAPRRHFDMIRRVTTVSKGRKLLKFDISPKLKKKLCAELDIDKTFPDEYNETTKT